MGEITATPPTAKRSAPDNSYRSLLRGMSAFGGVQVLQLVINLLRGKCVALLLGPEGMGVTQLFNSSTRTLKDCASMGLGQSIVREVAAAESPDSTFTPETVAIAARRAVMITAVGAIVLYSLLSPWLSRLTFGNGDYTWSFVILSAFVALTLVGEGDSAILQGMHQVKRLAWASLIGASAGLLIGVPLYYFFGNGGIVPAMIAVALCAWLFYRINLGKALPHGRVSVPWTVQRAVMKRLFSFGAVLMAGTLILSLVNYLINIYVRAHGSVDDVGLFQAANSIAGQYVGVVFTAMAMDYFPRLSAASSDNSAMRDIVNRQLQLGVLVITPLAVLLIATAPIVIRLLTSESFMPVVPVVRWMALGLFMRAACYPLGYVTFATGNKRIYFCLEGLWANGIMLLVNCVCFYLWGLVGLGISVLLVHTCDFISYYAVNRRYYDYRIGRQSWLILLPNAAIVTLALLATFIPHSTTSIILLCAIAIISITTSLLALRSRLRA